MDTEGDAGELAICGQSALLPPRWQTKEEFQGLIRELGMRNAICAKRFWGPDNELFTSGMKDVMVQSSPVSGMDPWCRS